MSFRYQKSLIVGALLACLALWFSARTPSNDRDWSPDQALLPRAEFQGDTVTIRNVRNFTYQTPLEYIPRWEDRTYRIDQLKKVWFIVEPFADYPGAAHTFLSFEFDRDQFLAISAEIRKERNEEFSAWKGLVRSYELMYVAGDEKDLLKLRSNYRGDTVYVYPIRTTPEKMRALFLSMLERMNALAQAPEFYNTLTNTCTTNIVRHVNTISPKRIPIRSEIFFPAEADRLAYELGLIDTELSFEKTRDLYRINERALRFADDDNFSRRIREPLGNK